MMSVSTCSPKPSRSPRLWPTFTPSLTATPVSRREPEKSDVPYISIQTLVSIEMYGTSDFSGSRRLTGVAVNDGVNVGQRRGEREGLGEQVLTDIISYQGRRRGRVWHASGSSGSWDFAW